jgi:DnaK suppressor protein
MDPERARELLSRERARIEGQIARLRERADPDARRDVTHPADEASDLFEEERDEGLAADLAEELAAVERAERRLEEGGYGLSIESGEPIPDERLEAIPHAERTAEEQTRFERGGL